MALHENVIFSLSWVAAPGTIGIYIRRATGAGMNCLSPPSRAQEVVRLFRKTLGGGTRYNFTIQKSAPCGPKRGPCARGNYVEFFSGPSEPCDVLRKTGNFRISRGLEKRAHVPSKSRFTATEVETVLDYRSLDFLHVWWFEVIFANLGIAKNKRHLTRKLQTAPNSGT